MLFVGFFLPKETVRLELLHVPLGDVADSGWPAFRILAHLAEENGLVALGWLGFCWLRGITRFFWRYSHKDIIYIYVYMYENIDIIHIIYIYYTYDTYCIYSTHNTSK